MHRATLATRAALRDRFAAVPARFLIASPGEVPTIEALEAAAPPPAGRARVGDVLAGAAGGPGTGVGPVRVVLDPGDCADLEPGDVLVCPITDPAWTPLFLAAAAVVVNVGALMSHAVDGDRGKVTVLEAAQA